MIYYKTQSLISKEDEILDEILGGETGVHNEFEDEN
jgi:hypothetical protein